MHRKPLFRLPIAVVVKLRRDESVAQTLNKIPPDCLWKLALVNINRFRDWHGTSFGLGRAEEKFKTWRRSVDLPSRKVYYFASMSFDISALLEQWDYQPGQVVVRKFRGRDGEDKIQLRVDLGLLQMNATGRPDGKHPYGRESLLEYYMDLLEKFRREHNNDDKDYRLTPEDCGRLQQEAIQYHHRYICLFQLEEFNGVIEDANRNLRVFDFVQKYAGSEELAWSLQQFRPQLLMMRVRARGATALKDNRYDEVVRLVEEGLDEIRQFYREHERQDMLEQSGEIQSLETWLQEIPLCKPCFAVTAGKTRDGPQRSRAQ